MKLQIEKLYKSASQKSCLSDLNILKLYGQPLCCVSHHGCTSFWST